MKRILLVEDDANLGFMLKEFLEMKGFRVTLAKDGEEGRDYFLEGQFDLGIFDIMMPKKDGFWLGEVVRSNNQSFPIIYLTAKSSKKDAIKGLEIGADDYITKPFSVDELLLRVKAVLRRVESYQHPSGLNKELEVLSIGKFALHYTEREFKGPKKMEKLTAREAQLLRLLIQNKNEVLERQMVLNALWGDDSYFSARSMDVYISKLRKKIKTDPNLEILNVHGHGFSLVEKNPGS